MHSRIVRILSSGIRHTEAACPRRSSMLQMGKHKSCFRERNLSVSAGCCIHMCLEAHAVRLSAKESDTITHVRNCPYQGSTLHTYSQFHEDHPHGCTLEPSLSLAQRWQFMSLFPFCSNRRSPRGFNISRRFQSRQ